MFVMFPDPNDKGYDELSREIREELTDAQREDLTEKAERGDIEAQLALAYYYRGEAEKKSELFRSIPSGSKYMRGPYCIDERNPVTDAVNEDRRAAFLWFERAAGQGSVEALYELSVCYLRGEGTPPFPEKSLALLKKAADAGYMLAQYDFGMLYLHGKTIMTGKEIPKDEALAVKWLLKAAEQGDSFAQYQLGECYEEGKGVEADGEEALAWYQKAADLGSELAEQALERLKED